MKVWKQITLVVGMVILEKLDYEMDDCYLLLRLNNIRNVLPIRI